MSFPRKGKVRVFSFLFSSRFKIRASAFLTLLCFAASLTGYAQIPFVMQSPSASPRLEVKIPNNIEIPKELGSIQFQQINSKNKPLVIYIQDAHSVIDAQNNIQKLIQYFSEQYGISLVALEGGQGELDPGILRSFPDEFSKKKIAAEYVNRGEIGGVELAAILNKNPADYVGIEDWNLYQENYQAYRQAMEQKERLIKKITSVKAQLREEIVKKYSKEHLDLFEKAEKFHHEELNLLDLVKGIQAVQKKNKEVQALLTKEKYPELVSLMGAIENDWAKDSTIDDSVKRMAEAFRKKFLSKLDKVQAMEFNNAVQSFKVNSIDAATLLKTLMDLGKAIGVRPKLTPAMEQLLGHAETLTMIKGTKLFDEMELALSDIDNALSKDEEVKELGAKVERLRLLENFASLELSRDQLEKIRADSESYLELLDEDRDAMMPAADFYRAALLRDGVFKNNLQKLMKLKQTKAAIVVTGGFHSTGFRRELEEEGISYAIITPRMNNLAGQETYAGMMASDVSYKKYLKTTFYDAFMQDATANLVAELNGPDYRKNLRFWRDDLLRKLYDEGKIAEAGDYTKYLDILLKNYVDRFGSSGPSKLKKSEIIRMVKDELGRFENETLSGMKERLDSQIQRFIDAYKRMGKGGAESSEVLRIARQAEVPQVSGLRAAANALALMRKGPQASDFLEGNQVFSSIPQASLARGAAFLAALKENLRAPSAVEDPRIAQVAAGLKQFEAAQDTRVDTILLDNSEIGIVNELPEAVSRQFTENFVSDIGRQYGISDQAARELVRSAVDKIDGKQASSVSVRSEMRQTKDSSDQGDEFTEIVRMLRDLENQRINSTIRNAIETYLQDPSAEGAYAKAQKAINGLDGGRNDKAIMLRVAEGLYALYVYSQIYSFKESILNAANREKTTSVDIDGPLVKSKNGSLALKISANQMYNSNQNGSFEADPASRFGNFRITVAIDREKGAMTIKNIQAMHYEIGLESQAARQPKDLGSVLQKFANSSWKISSEQAQAASPASGVEGRKSKTNRRDAATVNEYGEIRKELRSNLAQMMLLVRQAADKDASGREQTLASLKTQATAFLDATKRISSQLNTIRANKFEQKGIRINENDREDFNRLASLSNNVRAFAKFVDAVAKNDQAAALRQIERAQRNGAEQIPIKSKGRETTLFKEMKVYEAQLFSPEAVRLKETFQTSKKGLLGAAENSQNVQTLKMGNTSVGFRIEPDNTLVLIVEKQTYRYPSFDPETNKAGEVIVGRISSESGVIPKISIADDEAVSREHGKFYWNSGKKSWEYMHLSKTNPTELPDKSFLSGKGSGIVLSSAARSEMRSTVIPPAPKTRQDIPRAASTSRVPDDVSEFILSSLQAMKVVDKSGKVTNRLKYKPSEIESARIVPRKTDPGYYWVSIAGKSFVIGFTNSNAIPGSKTVQIQQGNTTKSVAYGYEGSRKINSRNIVYLASKGQTDVFSFATEKEMRTARHREANSYWRDINQEIRESYLRGDITPFDKLDDEMPFFTDELAVPLSGRIQVAGKSVDIDDDRSLLDRDSEIVNSYRALLMRTRTTYFLDELFAWFWLFFYWSNSAKLSLTTKSAETMIPDIYAQTMAIRNGLNQMDLRISKATKGVPLHLARQFEDQRQGLQELLDSLSEVSGGLAVYMQTLLDKTKDTVKEPKGRISESARAALNARRAERKKVMDMLFSLMEVDKLIQDVEDDHKKFSEKFEASQQNKQTDLKSKRALLKMLPKSFRVYEDREAPDLLYEDHPDRAKASPIFFQAKKFGRTGVFTLYDIDKMTAEALADFREDVKQRPDDEPNDLFSFIENYQNDLIKSFNELSAELRLFETRALNDQTKKKTKTKPVLTKAQRDRYHQQLQTINSAILRLRRYAEIAQYELSRYQASLKRSDLSKYQSINVLIMKLEAVKKWTNENVIKNGIYPKPAGRIINAANKAMNPARSEMRAAKPVLIIEKGESTQGPTASSVAKPETLLGIQTQRLAIEQAIRDRQWMVRRWELIIENATDLSPDREQEILQAIAGQRKDIARQEESLAEIQNRENQQLEEIVKNFGKEKISERTIASMREIYQVLTQQMNEARGLGGIGVIGAGVEGVDESGQPYERFESYSGAQEYVRESLRRFQDLTAMLNTINTIRGRWNDRLAAMLKDSGVPQDDRDRVRLLANKVKQIPSYDGRIVEVIPPNSEFSKNGVYAAPQDLIKTLQEKDARMSAQYSEGLARLQAQLRAFQTTKKELEKRLNAENDESQREVFELRITALNAEIRALNERISQLAQLEAPDWLKDAQASNPSARSEMRRMSDEADLWKTLVSRDELEKVQLNAAELSAQYREAASIAAATKGTDAAKRQREAVLLQKKLDAAFQQVASLEDKYYMQQRAIGQSFQRDTSDLLQQARRDLEALNNELREGYQTARQVMKMIRGRENFQAEAWSRFPYLYALEARKTRLEALIKRLEPKQYYTKGEFSPEALKPASPTRAWASSLGPLVQSASTNMLIDQNAEKAIALFRKVEMGRIVSPSEVKDLMRELTDLTARFQAENQRMSARLFFTRDLLQLISLFAVQKGEVDKAEVRRAYEKFKASANRGYPSNIFKTPEEASSFIRNAEQTVLRIERQPPKAGIIYQPPAAVIVDPKPNAALADVVDRATEKVIRLAVRLQKGEAFSGVEVEDARQALQSSVDEFFALNNRETTRSAFGESLLDFVALFAMGKEKLDSSLVRAAYENFKAAAVQGSSKAFFKTDGDLLAFIAAVEAIVLKLEKRPAALVLPKQQAVVDPRPDAAKADVVDRAAEKVIKLAVRLQKGNSFSDVEVEDARRELESAADEFFIANNRETGRTLFAETLLEFLALFSSSNEKLDPSVIHSAYENFKAAATQSYSNAIFATDGDFMAFVAAMEAVVLKLEEKKPVSKDPRSISKAAPDSAPLPKPAAPKSPVILKLDAIDQVTEKAVQLFRRVAKNENITPAEINDLASELDTARKEYEAREGRKSGRVSFALNLLQLIGYLSAGVERADKSQVRSISDKFKRMEGMSFSANLFKNDAEISSFIRDVEALAQKVEAKSDLTPPLAPSLAPVKSELTLAEARSALQSAEEYYQRDNRVAFNNAVKRVNGEIGILGNVLEIGISEGNLRQFTRDELSRYIDLSQKLGPKTGYPFNHASLAQKLYDGTARSEMRVNAQGIVDNLMAEQRRKFPTQRLPFLAENPVSGLLTNAGSRDFSGIILTRTFNNEKWEMTNVMALSFLPGTRPENSSLVLTHRDSVTGKLKRTLVPAMDEPRDINDMDLLRLINNGQVSQESFIVGGINVAPGQDAALGFNNNPQSSGVVGGINVSPSPDGVSMIRPGTSFSAVSAASASLLERAKLPNEAPGQSGSQAINQAPPGPETLALIDRVNKNPMTIPPADAGQFAALGQNPDDKAPGPGTLALIDRVNKNPMTIPPADAGQFAALGQNPDDKAPGPETLALLKRVENPMTIPPADVGQFPATAQNPVRKIVENFQRLNPEASRSFQIRLDRVQTGTASFDENGIRIAFLRNASRRPQGIADVRGLEYDRAQNALIVSTGSAQGVKRYQFSADGTVKDLGPLAAPAMLDAKSPAKDLKAAALALNNFLNNQNNRLDPLFSQLRRRSAYRSIDSPYSFFIGERLLLKTDWEKDGSREVTEFSSPVAGEYGMRIESDGRLGLTFNGQRYLIDLQGKAQIARSEMRQTETQTQVRLKSEDWRKIIRNAFESVERDSSRGWTATYGRDAGRGVFIFELEKDGVKRQIVVQTDGQIRNVRPKNASDRLIFNKPADYQGRKLNITIYEQAAVSQAQKKTTLEIKTDTEPEIELPLPAIDPAIQIRDAQIAAIQQSTDRVLDVLENANLKGPQAEEELDAIWNEFRAVSGVQEGLDRIEIDIENKGIQGKARSLQQLIEFAKIAKSVKNGSLEKIKNDIQSQVVFKDWARLDDFLVKSRDYRSLSKILESYLSGSKAAKIETAPDFDPEVEGKLLKVDKDEFLKLRRERLDLSDEAKNDDFLTSQTGDLTRGILANSQQITKAADRIIAPASSMAARLFNWLFGITPATAQNSPVVFYEMGQTLQKDLMQQRSALQNAFQSLVNNQEERSRSRKEAQRTGVVSGEAFTRIIADQARSEAILALLDESMRVTRMLIYQQSLIEKLPGGKAKSLLKLKEKLENEVRSLARLRKKAAALNKSLPEELGTTGTEINNLANKQRSAQARSEMRQTSGLSASARLKQLETSLNSQIAEALIRFSDLRKRFPVLGGDTYLKEKLVEDLLDLPRTYGERDYETPGRKYKDADKALKQLRGEQSTLTSQERLRFNQLAQSRNLLRDLTVLSLHLLDYPQVTQEQFNRALSDISASGGRAEALKIKGQNQSVLDFINKTEADYASIVAASQFLVAQVPSADPNKYYQAIKDAFLIQGYSLSDVVRSVNFQVIQSNVKGVSLIEVTVKSSPEYDESQIAPAEFATHRLLLRMQPSLDSLNEEPGQFKPALVITGKDAYGEPEQRIYKVVQRDMLDKNFDFKIDILGDPKTALTTDKKQALLNETFKAKDPAQVSPLEKANQQLVKNFQERYLEDVQTQRQVKFSSDTANQLVQEMESHLENEIGKSLNEYKTEIAALAKKTDFSASDYRDTLWTSQGIDRLEQFLKRLEIMARILNEMIPESEKRNLENRIFAIMKKIQKQQKTQKERAESIKQQLNRIREQEVKEAGKAILKAKNVQGFDDNKVIRELFKAYGYKREVYDRDDDDDAFRFKIEEIDRTSRQNESYRMYEISTRYAGITYKLLLQIKPSTDDNPPSQTRTIQEPQPNGKVQKTKYEFEETQAFDKGRVVDVYSVGTPGIRDWLTITADGNNQYHRLTPEEKRDYLKGKIPTERNDAIRGNVDYLRVVTNKSSNLGDLDAEMKKELNSVLKQIAPYSTLGAALTSQDAQIRARKQALEASKQLFDKLKEYKRTLSDAVKKQGNLYKGRSPAQQTAEKSVFLESAYNLGILIFRLEEMTRSLGLALEVLQAELNTTQEVTKNRLATENNKIARNLLTSLRQSFESINEVGAEQGALLELASKIPDPARSEMRADPADLMRMIGLLDKMNGILDNYLQADDAKSAYSLAYNQFVGLQGSAPAEAVKPGSAALNLYYIMRQMSGRILQAAKLDRTTEIDVIGNFGGNISFVDPQTYVKSDPRSNVPANGFVVTVEVKNGRLSIKRIRGTFREKTTTGQAATVPVDYGQYLKGFVGKSWPVPAALRPDERPSQSVPTVVPAARVQIGNTRLEFEAAGPTLKIVQRGLRGERKVLLERKATEGSFTIGRSVELDNALILNDPDVSRVHARVGFDTKKKVWVIMDLKSTNGISVNGELHGGDNAGSSWIPLSEPSTSVAAAGKNTTAPSQTAASFLAPVVRADLGQDVIFKILPDNSLQIGSEGNSQTYPAREVAAITFGRNLQDTSTSFGLLSQDASRQHAELKFINGQWMIRDLGSKNGTRVNGQLLEKDRAIPLTANVGELLRDSVQLWQSSQSGRLSASESVRVAVDAVREMTGAIKAFGDLPPYAATPTEAELALAQRYIKAQEVLKSAADILKSVPISDRETAALVLRTLLETARAFNRSRGVGLDVISGTFTDAAERYSLTVQGSTDRDTAVFGKSVFLKVQALRQDLVKLLNAPRRRGDDESIPRAQDPLGKHITRSEMRAKAEDLQSILSFKTTLPSIENIGDALRYAEDLLAKFNQTQITKENFPAWQEAVLAATRAVVIYEEFSADKRLEQNLDLLMGMDGLSQRSRSLETQMGKLIKQLFQYRPGNSSDQFDLALRIAELFLNGLQTFQLAANKSEGLTQGKQFYEQAFSEYKKLLDRRAPGDARLDFFETRYDASKMKEAFSLAKELRDSLKSGAYRVSENQNDLFRLKKISRWVSLYTNVQPVFTSDEKKIAAKSISAEERQAISRMLGLQAQDFFDSKLTLETWLAQYLQVDLIAGLLARQNLKESGEAAPQAEVKTFDLDIQKPGFGIELKAGAAMWKIDKNANNELVLTYTEPGISPQVVIMKESREYELGGVVFWIPKNRYGKMIAVINRNPDAALEIAKNSGFTEKASKTAEDLPPVKSTPIAAPAALSKTAPSAPLPATIVPGTVRLDDIRPVPLSAPAAPAVAASQGPREFKVIDPAKMIIKINVNQGESNWAVKVNPYDSTQLWVSKANTVEILDVDKNPVMSSAGFRISYNAASKTITVDPNGKNLEITTDQHSKENLKTPTPAPAPAPSPAVAAVQPAVAVPAAPAVYKYQTFSLGATNGPSIIVTREGESYRLTSSNRTLNDILAKIEPFKVTAGAREFVIGRNTPDNQVDIDFSDPNLAQGISRKHAKLVIDPSGKVTIMDLGSTHGVYVNGSKITGSGNLAATLQARSEMRTAEESSEAKPKANDPLSWIQRNYRFALGLIPMPMDLLFGGNYDTSPGSVESILTASEYFLAHPIRSYDIVRESFKKIFMNIRNPFGRQPKVSPQDTTQKRSEMRQPISPKILPQGEEAPGKVRPTIRINAANEVPSKYRYSRAQSLVAAVVLAIPTLLLLIGPLTLIMILSDIPGFYRDGWKAIFFTQPRMTLEGKEFNTYKFVTMTREPDVDKRTVTWIGKILRPTGLDESPQILNILMGQMALLGRRPEQKKDLNTFTPELRKRYMEDVVAKRRPGMFGLAALLTGFGASAGGKAFMRDEDIVRWTKQLVYILDIYEQEHWSDKFRNQILYLISIKLAGVFLRPLKSVFEGFMMKEFYRIVDPAKVKTKLDELFPEGHPDRSALLGLLKLPPEFQPETALTPAAAARTRSEMRVDPEMRAFRAQFENFPGVNQISDLFLDRTDQTRKDRLAQILAIGQEFQLSETTLNALVEAYSEVQKILVTESLTSAELQFVGQGATMEAYRAKLPGYGNVIVKFARRDGKRLSATGDSINLNPRQIKAEEASHRTLYGQAKTYLGELFMPLLLDNLPVRIDGKTETIPFAIVQIEFQTLQEFRNSLAARIKALNQTLAESNARLGFGAWMSTLFSGAARDQYESYRSAREAAQAELEVLASQNAKVIQAHSRTAAEIQSRGMRDIDTIRIFDNYGFPLDPQGKPDPSRAFLLDADSVKMLPGAQLKERWESTPFPQLMDPYWRAIVKEVLSLGQRQRDSLSAAQVTSLLEKVRPIVQEALPKVTQTIRSEMRFVKSKEAVPAQVSEPKTEFEKMVAQSLDEIIKKNPEFARLPAEEKAAALNQLLQEKETQILNAFKNQIAESEGKILESLEDFPEIPEAEQAVNVLKNQLGALREALSEYAEALTAMEGRLVSSITGLSSGEEAASPAQAEAQASWNKLNIKDVAAQLESKTQALMEAPGVDLQTAIGFNVKTRAEFLEYANALKDLGIENAKVSGPIELNRGDRKLFTRLEFKRQSRENEKDAIDFVTENTFPDLNSFGAILDVQNQELLKGLPDELKPIVTEGWGEVPPELRPAIKKLLVATALQKDLGDPIAVLAQYGLPTVGIINEGGYFRVQVNAFVNAIKAQKASAVSA